MKDLIKKIILAFFIGVPLGFSIVSTIHIVDLFYLGNSTLLTYISAIGIELGAIASFLSLSVMKRLNKAIVWSSFVLLFLLQIIGNVYSSYSWVSAKVADDPNWLANFQDMLNFIVTFKDVRDVKMILAMIVGVPAPLFSVFLLKSTMDYLEPAVTMIDEIPQTESAENVELPPSTEIDNTEGSENDDIEKKRLHPSRQTS